MFEVKGIPILVDDVQILYDLKNEVQQKLGREILRKIKPSGDNIMICCPMHNEGQERRPSCGISRRRYKDKPAGVVHCFTCGYIDSLEGMISKCFGYEGTSFGENWLLQNYVNAEIYERPDLNLNLSRDNNIAQVNYISEKELASYRYYHPYMYQRKLNNEVIERYDVGYQKDFKFEYEENGIIKYLPPQEVLTFPVKDEKGRCLFVSRRSIKGKTFFLPKDIEKPVYGIYELPKDCKEVIICESVINALTCVAYGRPAYALFGTGDKNQYETLKRLPVRKYIIGLHPDDAGKKGTEKLKYYLRDKVLTKLILPKGKDINDLSSQEFIQLPEIFI